MGSQLDLVLVQHAIRTEPDIDNTHPATFRGIRLPLMLVLVQTAQSPSLSGSELSVHACAASASHGVADFAQNVEFVWIRHGISPARLHHCTRCTSGNSSKLC